MRRRKEGGRRGGCFLSMVVGERRATEQDQTAFKMLTAEIGKVQTCTGFSWSRNYIEYEGLGLSFYFT